MQFAANLNLRQQQYLHLALRHKLNKELPIWNTIHLTPESPFKMAIEVLPSLSAGARINELKCLPKNGVMK